MVASRRLQNAKSDRFHENVNRRGKVTSELEKIRNKGKGLAVGPVLLGFFLFVVVGSALLQIIRTATSGNSMFS